MKWRWPYNANEAIRHDERFCKRRAEMLLPMIAAAISGAIIGFFFAGEVLLSASVFLTLSFGFSAGWWVRGLANVKDTK